MQEKVINLAHLMTKVLESNYNGLFRKYNTKFTTEQFAKTIRNELLFKIILKNIYLKKCCSRASIRSV